ncbi:MAG: TolC family protein [Myxococcota bacterium]
MQRLRTKPWAWRAAVALFASMMALPAHAETPERVLPADANLTKLIDESIAARPELARARAVVRANQERVPQARALPDPMLQVGIQNDGFKSIEIGRMETSFVSLMASQTLPWPGKRDLQAKLAELDVEDAARSIARAQLSTEAEVRRAYLDLLLARDRLALLAQLESVWERALSVTRTLYQTGSGSQSDMLRAELEQRRLQQRRIALQAEERSNVHALNRLRNRPLDEPIATTSHLKDLPRLESLRTVFSEQRALSQSPELSSARLSITRAGKATALAEKGYYPDVTVGAGIMYRGALPPMWQLTLGAPIPIFNGAKRGRVAESRERTSIAESDIAALQQVVRLRTRERQTAFEAALANIAIYDQGLLLLSETTAQSTLVQYTTGKVTFASVLEANAGFLADQDGYLEALAGAHRILIAEAELSLERPLMPSSAASGTGMPAAGSAGMAAPASAKGAAAPSATPAAMPSSSM